MRTAEIGACDPGASMVVERLRNDVEADPPALDGFIPIQISPTAYSSLVADPLALDPLSPDPLSPIETRPIGDTSALANEGDS